MTAPFHEGANMNTFTFSKDLKAKTVLRPWTGGDGNTSAGGMLEGSYKYNNVGRPFTADRHCAHYVLHLRKKR